MENKTEIKTYRDLIVWQKSMDIVVNIYKLTNNFPKSEIYGLTSQMRRCAVSIPSNIAEGRGRGKGSKKDYRHFLIISYSSGKELETQIEIAKRLQFNKNSDFIKVDNLLNEVMRMLNKMLSKLKN